MKNLLRHGVALTFAATAAGSVSAADVVVSIKPLHSLVAGVMGDTGSPYLILPGASSPHTYQMRPTQAAEIDQADLIVWVGEELETFLSRPIANLGEGSMVLTAHEFEGLRLYATRAGGIWQDHADHDEHDHGKIITIKKTLNIMTSTIMAAKKAIMTSMTMATGTAMIIRAIKKTLNIMTSTIMAAKKAIMTSMTMATGIAMIIWTIRKTLSITTNMAMTAANMVSTHTAMCTANMTCTSG